MIQNLLGSLIKPVTSIVDQIVEDKDLNAKLKHEIDKQILQGENRLAMREFDLAEAQIQINHEDAKSGKFFQSGWRPLVAWGCGLGVLLHVMVFPLAEAFMPDFVSPHLDTEMLWGMLAPLLGLGGARSFDKAKLSAEKAKQKLH